MSVGGEFFPSSPCIAAEDGGVYSGTCSVECDKEVTADCVENTHNGVSVVGHCTDFQSASHNTC